MKYLLLLSTVILLVGCATQRRAEKFYSKNKDKLAILCHDEFPPSPPTIKSDTVVNTDTLWGAGTTDTVYVNDTVKVIVKLPGKEIRTTTIIRDSIKTEDPYYKEVLNNKIKSLEIAKALSDTSAKKYKALYENLQAKNNGKLIIRIPWWLLALIGVAGVLILWLRIKNGALRSVISKLKNQI